MTQIVHPATLARSQTDLSSQADWTADEVSGWEVPAVTLDNVRRLSERVTLHHGWVLRDEHSQGPGLNLVRNLHDVRRGAGIIATDAFLDAADPLPHDADPRPLWAFHDSGTGTRVQLFTLFGTDRSEVALPRANFGALAGPLFGRLDELQEIDELVDAHPTVLLKGPPGIGKTSLARHFAWDWATRHAPAPAWWVDFPVGGGRDELSIEVARAIGVLQHLPTDAEERELHIGRVLSNLAPNLLVLDGVDEATEETLEFAAQLTALSDDTRVLVTSQVAPPRTPAFVRDLRGLDEAAAVKLYLHRRRLRRPEVPIADRDLRAARDAARDLAGTPAAIEVVSVSLEEEPLPEAAVSSPATTRTIAWAGARLTRPAVALLRSLQVFKGPFDFDHVRSVSDAEDVEAQFESLLDLSMVAGRMEEEQVFFLPSTVRRWARSELGEPSDDTRRRWLAGWVDRARAFVHAAQGTEEIEAVRRYRAFAHQAVDALDEARRTSHPGLPWLFRAAFDARITQLSRLDRIFTNLPPIKDPELAAFVGLAGARISHLRGKLDEALARLEGFPAEAPDELRSMCDASRASYESLLGRDDDARSRIDGLLKNDLRSDRIRAVAREVRSRIHLRADDLEAADEAVATGVREAEASGHPTTIAALRSARAIVALKRNRLETARQLYTDALPIFTALGRDHACAVVIGNLAHVDLHLGHLTAARNGFLQSIDLARRALRPNPEAISRLGLAWVELRRGDELAARDELQRASTELEAMGNTYYAGIANAWLAVTHALRGEPTEAHDELARAREHLPDPGDQTADILRLVESTVEGLLGADRASVTAALDQFRDIGHDGTSARAAAMLVEALVDELEDTGPADLVLAPDGRWFRLQDEDEKVDIARRTAPRRVLVALARQHLDAPGEPLSLEDLFEAGWPDEVATAEAAANRVYVTVATLRKLGLRDLLLSLGDGYGLDPDCVVQFDK